MAPIDGRATLDLAYPFTGWWLVQNSPADRVPSHGTTQFATSYAIDFVPVDAAGRSARFTAASLFRTEPPERFSGFGRLILAPAGGRVIAAHDGEPDHHAHRGFPSIGYAMTQRMRIAAGWVALAGNHVLLETAGVVVALCHLQQGSVGVLPGDIVRAGVPLGRCGNSGNSTEPHVHVQALSGPDVERATAVPITFRGDLPHNGTVVEV
ncbi:M23 family metallopeptidase [Microbacterium sp. NPDC057659]|uniref:M23 family metallopeptidase n=1 Tax=Microbacterium sp. NPDC057659 TaxID=3346198 RepID=UPI003671E2AA